MIAVFILPFLANIPLITCRKSCGQPVVSPLLDSSGFRIYGGREARPHSWPWQAHIMSCYSGVCELCGGSLISPNKVITAAHCTDYGAAPASAFKVRLGTHNFRSNVGTEQGDVQVGVKSYYTWSTDSQTFNNDLAILTLDTKVAYTDTIGSVCVAFKDPPAGTLCYATGWGYTETGWTDVLKQVALPISTDKDCATEVGTGMDVHTKICAGARQGKDTCQGDSGGPLVCFMNDSWKLVGVTSYGNAECGAKGRPGVYTKISYFYDFIYERI